MIIRSALCSLLMTVLLFMPRPANAQLELLNSIEGLSELAMEHGIDPTMIRVPTAAEMQQFWQLLNTTLQSESIEDLAWLSPYAGMALSYLDGIPEARPYADWLRQRLDYLLMAEEVMKEERAIKRLPPPPPPTRKPTSIATAPPKPAAPSTSVAKKKTMSQERWQKRVASRPPPKGADHYVPRLKPIFKAEGVPVELVWLAEVESSFDPVARSPVGALGLYQFMPATAERFGLSLKPEDERIVPERSATAAAKYLKVLHKRFGSWSLALAAYNAGEGRVGKLLTKHQATTFEGISDFLPSETRMYVPKVAAVVKVREGADLNRL